MRQRLRAVASADLAAVAPGMSALYSVRKQRGAYTGACLRVRRSSDNTESDIGFASGKLDTGALLAFVGAGDGFVATWYDQSGNGRHATQATAAKQMYVVQAGATTAFGTKGDVAIWNPAQDRWLSYTQPVHSTGYSSMVVHRLPSSAFGVFYSLTAAAGPYWGADATDTNLFDHTGNPTTSSNLVARVLLAAYDSGNKRLRSSAGTATNATALGYTIGNGMIGTYGDGYTNPSNAQFHTCVVWPMALTDLDGPYNLAIGWI